MDMRLYEPRDRFACLAVFDSAAPDLPDFDLWLDQPEGPYFVMEHEGSIVGCGGYSLSADGAVARLQWGMVRSDAQRMGLGRFLLLYRIREIGKVGTVGMVVARVPKASAGFFEKQGFRVNAAGDDGRVELLKKLTVCN